MPPAAGIRPPRRNRDRSSREENIIASKVFVGNLSYETTQRDLESLFEEIGPVADVFLPADRNTGRPKGCAFIEFEDPESVATAIEKLDGYELGGRMLRVNEAEERPQRPRFSPDARPSFGKKSRPKGSRRKIRGRKRSL